MIFVAFFRRGNETATVTERPIRPSTGLFGEDEMIRVRTSATSIHNFGLRIDRYCVSSACDLPGNLIASLTDRHTNQTVHGRNHVLLKSDESVPRTTERYATVYHECYDFREQTREIRFFHFWLCTRTRTRIWEEQPQLRSSRSIFTMNPDVNVFRYILLLCTNSSLPTTLHGHLFRRISKATALALSFRSVEDCSPQQILATTHAPMTRRNHGKESQIRKESPHSKKNTTLFPPRHFFHFATSFLTCDTRVFIPKKERVERVP